MLRWHTVYSGKMTLVPLLGLDDHELLGRGGGVDVQLAVGQLGNNSLVVHA